MSSENLEPVAGSLLAEKVDSNWAATVQRLENLWEQNRTLRELIRVRRNEVREALTALKVTVSEVRSANQANQESDTPQPTLGVLSPRERQVLTLISESYTTKEIGHILSISFRTAVNHRTNIMTKLGIHDVAGLTRFAIRSGVSAGHGEQLQRALTFKG